MKTSITFIGAGNMASAIIGGLVMQQPDISIAVSDIDKDKLYTLKNRYPVQIFNDNIAAIAQSEVIIFAVKPNIIKSLCAELKAQITSKAYLLISIAAGITCRSLQQWLTPSQAIIRVMPNTPSLIQQGMSGLFATPHCTADDQKICESILQTVGKIVWLKQEQDIDVVTALSGSGPAYYYLFMEYMIKRGIALGLSPEISTQLVKQTALGASHMVSQSDTEIAKLRQQVTSPGGTTEQAIQSFMTQGLEQQINAAIDAAYTKSIALGKELGK